MLFGMQSRTMVMSPGFCPILRLDLNAYGLGAIPIEYGRVLWLKMFPMWVKCTLHSPFFEVWSQFFNFT